MDKRISNEYLNKLVTVVIDRPMGSKHPEWGFEYLVNYGYIPGIIAEDGEELDAYVLGVTKPIKKFTGRCIRIIHRENDFEDKLVVVKDGVVISDEQILSLTNFQEKFFKIKIVR